MFFFIFPKPKYKKKEEWEFKSCEMISNILIYIQENVIKNFSKLMTVSKPQNKELGEHPVW